VHTVGTGQEGTKKGAPRPLFELLDQGHERVRGDSSIWVQKENELNARWKHGHAGVQTGAESGVLPLKEGQPLQSEGPHNLHCVVRGVIVHDNESAEMPPREQL